MASDWKKVGRDLGMIGAGVLLGLVVALSIKGNASPRVTGGNLMASLPEVEVAVDGRTLGKAAYAVAPLARSEAWLLYVTEPRRTVLVWEAPANYPVYDVPPGWSVAWLDGQGVVQGSSTSPGTRTNMVMSGKSILRAVVLPESEVPRAGQKVAFYSREEKR